MSVRTIGIIGAGAMGRSAAQIAASAGLDVILIDIDGSALDQGITAIERNLDRLVTDRLISATDRVSALSRITRATACDPLANADVVIEAVTDDVRLKTRILKQLDPLLRRDAIVASTTSSISITRLASETAFPERFIGMHFFSPLTGTALVEIVRGLRTSDNTHDVIDTLSLKLGKIPITVKNRPGFIVNRILTPMLNEAFFVLAEGDATPTEIDEGLKLGCNHPVGPLALADIIGLDVVLSVIQSIHRESGDPKYRPAPLLSEMVAANFLGQKSGRGVYRY